MFTSQSFFFVPAHRQINVFLTEEDARANVDVIGLFTQLENASTDYTLDVHGRELKLDLEFPDGDPRLPKDTAVPEWTAAIIDHIAPYIKDGVITPYATFGEITVDDRGNGIWFLARNNESVTLNNENHVPDAECEQWVAYSKSCACCGGTPDFEFVGVDSSVLNVPEGMTLGEHLIPFIEAMEAQYRARAQEGMLGGLDALFGQLGVAKPAAMSRAKKHRTVVHHAVAGTGKLMRPVEQNEIGRVVIGEEPVLVMYPDHCIALGKRADGDFDSEIDVDSDLRKVVSRKLNELMRIPFEDINSKVFHVGMMRDVIWRAMAGEYKDNGMVDHQVYHTARSVATPGKVNWWLRVLVNMWFMHLNYPSYNVHQVMRTQIRELAQFMDVDDAQTTELMQRLVILLEYWRDHADKQG